METPPNNNKISLNSNHDYFTPCNNSLLHNNIEKEFDKEINKFRSDEESFNNRTIKNLNDSSNDDNDNNTDYLNDYSSLDYNMNIDENFNLSNQSNYYQEQLETPSQMPESTSMTPKQTGLPILPFVATDSHASTPPWVLDTFSMSLNNDNDNNDEVDENVIFQLRSKSESSRTTNTNTNNINAGTLTINTSTNDVETDIEDGETEKIMMAISYRYHKLGCAYYNDAASKLYLMEDMDESPPYDLVNLLRYQILPSAIIVSSRADEVLVDLLKSKDDSIPIEPIVEIRPSSEFIYSSARTKLYNSCLNTKTFENNIYGESYKHETYLKLSSIIDMESVESVCCAGALITYISKSKITDVATTNISIKIFEDEAHPNMHMRSHTKEGLSLFGIMNCTRTTLGKRLLKQWFLRPTLDISIIHERQHTIECFIKPDNLKASSLLTKCLKHIKNIERIVQNIKGKLSVKDWQSLLQFAFYCLKIRNLIKEFHYEEPLQIFKRIEETFSITNFKTFGSLINDMIDFDGSVKENRIVIKPYIDEDLDEMKRVYDGLDDFLSEVANEISTTIPNEITTSLNVIYYPQLGYLIAVPLKLEWKDEKDFEFDGLYFQFNTSTTVYYKNDRMKGDIHGLIVDKEIEIIQKLQDRILQYVNLLLNASVLCSELDCLLCLAESARRYRHPLQELCVEVFVANDTFIEGGHGTLIDDDYQDTTMTNMNTNGLYESSKPNNNSVILLSGANFSGKSVYLKQVALITYMAHIGSFVPAESAIIGLTDKIFTRIQTRETISKIQSAFMIDLQQISFALRNSTSKSLLIIDEFGKGTGSTAGLFCGVIEHLLKRGHNCPKVIAATHFHEIFENDLLSASLPITLATMEIFKDDRDEELTFLYRLVQGRSTSSWGTFCAAISGVPLHCKYVYLQQPIAKYLSQLFSRYESIPPPFGDHIEQRSYTKYEQVARKFLQLDLKHPEVDFNDFLDWISRECV
nr:9277_t:CDS:10 [Entrophospora candida]